MIEERIKKRFDKEDGIDKMVSKRQERKETLEARHKRNEPSTKGSETFTYIPAIRLRKRMKLETDHDTTFSQWS